MNETRSRIREYLIETFLFGDGSRLGDDTSFMETGILDSTGMLELISYAEQEFGISIDPSELVPDNLDSIRNLTAFIERKKKESSSGTAA